MSNNVQALNDAERGVAENVFAVDLPPPTTTPPMSQATTRVNSVADLKANPPPLPTSDLPLPDEKKVEADAALAVVKKEASASNAKKPAPPKAKWKRASRWVRFNLWYNTYRSVIYASELHSLSATNGIQSFALLQEILYSRCDVERHRDSASSAQRLDLPPPLYRRFRSR